MFTMKFEDYLIEKSQEQQKRQDLEKEVTNLLFPKLLAYIL